MPLGARKEYWEKCRAVYNGRVSIPTIDINELAPQERLQLIGELWDSLSAHPESLRLTTAQQKELDHRLDSLDRGEAEVVPWSEVRRRLCL